MFKRVENAWNARTPVYLHNGTKENIIFQLTLTAVLVGGYIAIDEIRERRNRRRYRTIED